MSECVSELVSVYGACMGLVWYIRLCRREESYRKECHYVLLLHIRCIWPIHKMIYGSLNFYMENLTKKNVRKFILANMSYTVIRDGTADDPLIYLNGCIVLPFTYALRRYFTFK